MAEYWWIARSRDQIKMEAEYLQRQLDRVADTTEGLAWNVGANVREARRHLLKAVSYLDDARYWTDDGTEPRQLGLPHMRDRAIGGGT